VRALAVETHENWLEQHRYLNMDDLREHKKEALGDASKSLDFWRDRNASGALSKWLRLRAFSDPF
jgi:hypothetical protein